METNIYPITTIALNDEKLNSIGFRIFCGYTINKCSGSKHPGLYWLPYRSKCKTLSATVF